MFATPDEIRAIAKKCGSQRALARRMKVSSASVSLWVRSSDPHSSISACCALVLVDVCREKGLDALAARIQKRLDAYNPE